MSWTSPDHEEFHGVFAIPVTPFLESGEVDLDSLQRQIDFCVDSGVHGIVYPAVVSEFFTLRPSERFEATVTAIKCIDGRVPFVAGVSGTSSASARELTESAADAGANGVMAMLPYVQHFFEPDLQFILDYFKDIGKAGGGIPIILQNPRIGYQVNLSSLANLVTAVPEIEYVKQETSPCTHDLTRVLQAGDTHLKGVFGGLGGIYMLNELDRGACGTMPAPAYVDVLAASYDRYRQGDRVGARESLASLAPLFNLELLYNVALIKEVLYRRGIIANTRCRVPVPVLDKFDLAELDELLSMARLGGI